MEEVREEKVSVLVVERTFPKGIWIPNKIPDESRNFTGRADFLETLKKGLEEGQSSNRAGLVVCAGLGGLGKTQLAIRYVHEALDRQSNQKSKVFYKSVFWITATTVRNIENSYLQIGVDQGLFTQEESEKDRDRCIKSMLAYFQKKPKAHCLFIYDDVADYPSLRPFLPISSPNNHVLITTRNKKFEDEVNRMVLLETFSYDDSKEFLVKELGPGIAFFEGDLQRLHDAVGGLPLALAQTCSVVREERKTDKSFGIKEYLHGYNDGNWNLRKAFLSKQEDSVSPDQRHEVVFTTWRVTMKRIIKTAVSSVGPLACSVLGFTAFLCNEHIPDFFLNDFVSLSEGDKPAALVKEILSILGQYSLLQSRDEAKGMSSIHILLQETIYLSLNHEERRFYFVVCFELFERYFSIKANLEGESTRQLIPHMAVFLKKTEEYSKNTQNQIDEIYALLYQLMVFVFASNTKTALERVGDTVTQDGLDFLNRFTSSTNAAQWAKQLERKLEEESQGEKDNAEVSVDILIALAKFYLFDSKRNKAISKWTEATRLFKKYKVNATQRAYIWESLANTYLENYVSPSEAIGAFYEALRVLYSPEYPEGQKTKRVADILFNLGNAYLKTGRNLYALDVFTEAKAIYDGTTNVSATRAENAKKKVKEAKTQVLCDLRDFSKKLSKESANIFLMIRVGILIFSSRVFSQDYKESSDKEPTISAQGSTQRWQVTKGTESLMLLEKAIDSCKVNSEIRFSIQKIEEISDYSLWLNVFEGQKVEINPIFLAYYWMIYAYCTLINSTEDESLLAEVKFDVGNRVKEFLELVCEKKDCDPCSLRLVRHLYFQLQALVGKKENAKISMVCDELLSFLQRLFSDASDIKQNSQKEKEESGKNDNNDNEKRVSYVSHFFSSPRSARLRTVFEKKVVETKGGASEGSQKNDDECKEMTPSGQQSLELKRELEEGFDASAIALPQKKCSIM